ncbi:MAG: DUF6522 family protein, partial [Paracoccaceae bacterium]
MTRIIRDANGFTVPAEIIAAGFDLTTDETARRMKDGEITSRSEEGSGDHAGRWRLTFFLGG